jgi:hypothetical protein
VKRIKRKKKKKEDVRDEWHQGEAQGHCKCRLNSANRKLRKGEREDTDRALQHGKMCADGASPNAEVRL